LADPRLASRSATGQPVNTGNVITSSAYRSPGVPDFFAGAVNDLNSGATAKAAMQAEWLSRLANSMGNAGDDAYLWAEVLRANGGLNPSGTGGGGPSFGAAITPGAIARGQGFLLTSQAAEINKRNALSGASAARTSMNWELQRQINSTMGNMAGSPIGTQPYVSQLFQQQAEKANNEYAAEALTRSAASLQPNQAALANRVIMPPNYGAPNGLINGTGYAIPYVSHPSGWAW
jgi:hypothetical protein